MMDMDMVRNAGVCFCAQVVSSLFSFNHILHLKKRAQLQLKVTKAQMKFMVYLSNCEQSPVPIVTTPPLKKSALHTKADDLSNSVLKEMYDEVKGTLLCTDANPHTYRKLCTLCTNQIHFCPPACCSPSGRPFIIYFFILSPHFACIGAHMVSRARALRYFLLFLLARYMLLFS